MVHHQLPGDLLPAGIGCAILLQYAGTWVAGIVRMFVSCYCCFFLVFVVFMFLLVIFCLLALVVLFFYSMPVRGSQWLLECLSLVIVLFRCLVCC